MRLHRLDLTAFGPYPNHESVDFDALGQDVHTRVTDGRLSLSVSATPIFIEPTK